MAQGTSGGEMASPPRIMRFGPFELDTRSGELRKHGIKIRLHQQPFRVLLMLVSNPGEVVLREEIRKALWPDDTVVEFDHGINTTIQRLRDALGDSADNPCYVETLPRRGYRFLVILESQASQSLDAAPPPLRAAAVVVPELPVASASSADLPKRTFIAGSNRRIAAAFGCLVLLAAGGWWTSRHSGSPRPTNFERLTFRQG